jgi:hypothetical protein
MSSSSSSFLRSSLSFAVLAALTAACGAVELGSDGTNEQSVVLGDGGAGSGCGIRGAQPCGAGLTCIFPASADCGATDKGSGTCTALPAACTTELDPVCGCDGVTYGNACTANAAGQSVKVAGACPGALQDAGVDGDAANPPVGIGAGCGSRGLGPCAPGLYCLWTQAAECGATDKPGSCQKAPDGCPTISQPVCACDDQTYSNECEARRAGMSVKKLGGC